MRTTLIALATLATTAFLATPQRDRTPDRPTPAAAVKSTAAARLEIPASIRHEHKALHDRLVQAVKAGGKTGDAALRVAELLHPHMLREEKYALPPLGMLRAFADGEVPAHAAQVLALTERFRVEYPRMLEEHEAIVAAFGGLLAAARAEHRDDIAEFAQELIRHVAAEEEILYPTTVLIGEYLKLMIAKDAPAAQDTPPAQNGRAPDGRAVGPTSAAPEGEFEGPASKE